VSLDRDEDVVAACVAMQARIEARELDPAGQMAFYATRFGDRVLLARWLTLLRGSGSMQPLQQ
jgi:hypothetical protein